MDRIALKIIDLLIKTAIIASTVFSLTERARANAYHRAALITYPIAS